MSSVGEPQIRRFGQAVDGLRKEVLYLECDLLDLDEITRIRELVTRTRAALDGLDADLARRGRDLRRGRDDSDVDAALNPNRRQSESKPPRDEARGELFDELPELGDATRSGDVPGEYSDVITRALKPLTEPERAEFLGRHRDLHMLAGKLGLEAFRRRIKAMVDQVLRDSGRDLLARQRRLRTARVGLDTETAMTTLFAKFDLETGARVKHSINVEVERLIHQRRDDPNDTRTRDQLLADAVTNLICGAQADGRQATDLVVLVDLHTLLDGLDHQQPEPVDPDFSGDPPAGAPLDQADGSTRSESSPPSIPKDRVDRRHRVCETSDGTRLPVNVIRRMACDAYIIPVVLSGDGVVLDEGRRKRLATREQRLALRTMYDTCAIDGCHSPFDRCEIHHTRPFGPPTNGNTDLHRLIPLCSRHHHHVHDNRWRLDLADDRTLTITHPDGRTEHHPFTPPGHIDDSEQHSEKAA